MKSKIIFEDVDKEALEQAESLGLPVPEKKERECEIHFDASYIHIAYINANGDIAAYFPSGAWVLNYNKDVWDAIKKQLNENYGMKQ